VARLMEKVAIVTGASRGIGRSVAIELAREGAAVVAAARSEVLLDEVVEEIGANHGNAMSVVCDVADSGQVDRLIAKALERFGRIDILVNAAQTPAVDATLENYPMADWELAMKSGLYGTMAVMRGAFPHMKKGPGGSIINFGDPDAIVGEPSKVAMNVTKEAVRALSRTAAREWGRYGIRVNVISPAARSERVAKSMAAQDDLERWILTQIPAGELGDVVDVARAVVFLASDDSAMLTGMTINVDGGRGMYA
jgi:2-hydroxycyclohexanecarboxyl-CoA dehydrogenase